MVTEKPKNSRFVGQGFCSVASAGQCVNRSFSTGWQCNTGFTRNTHGTDTVSDDTCDPPPYRDIGLRIQNGGRTYKIAGELPGEILSPFRIWRTDPSGGNTYGALLVSPWHPDASGLRMFKGGKVWSFITF